MPDTTSTISWRLRSSFDGPQEGSQLIAFWIAVSNV